MADEPRSWRVSDTVLAAVVAGIFGTVGIVLTQWKDMPWNARASAPEKAAAIGNISAPAQPIAIPAADQAMEGSLGSAPVEAAAHPSVAKAQGHWVMPARFVIDQANCNGPVEVIGTWDNGVELRDGVATNRCDPGSPGKGRATGTFRQGHLKMTIEWDTPGAESVGIYQGAVDRDGNVSGFTYAQGHREWGQPAWNGTRALERSH